MQKSHRLCRCEVCDEGSVKVLCEKRPVVAKVCGWALVVAE